ncbi:MAG TPA: hypothetical protein V6C58_17690 [Allocoleopsis sp.]
MVLNIISGIIDYLRIKEISNKNIFSYILVVIFVIILSTRVINVNLGHVLAVIVSILIIYVLFVFETEDVSEFNKEMQSKLDSLDSEDTEFLHLDVNLINLFHNIKENFAKYNKKSYLNAIKSANNLLRIRNDIEKKLCPPDDPPFLLDNFEIKTEKPKTCDKILNNAYENFQVAENQTKLCINYIHSLILSVPTDNIHHSNLSKVIRRAHILLKRNLDIIFSIIEEKNYSEISYTTRYITDYDDYKPYDKNLSKETNFNFY